MLQECVVGLQVNQTGPDWLVLVAESPSQFRLASQGLEELEGQTGVQGSSAVFNYTTTQKTHKCQEGAL